MSIATASALDHTGWRAEAEAARRAPETRLFVGGEFLPGSERPFASVNPATGETLAELQAAGPREVDLAVRSARAAFRGGAWSRLAPRERAAVMQRWRTCWTARPRGSA
jgi:gamma-glutamyl-gamma-aminobutyraldehyde dehydrogenase